MMMMCVGCFFCAFYGAMYVCVFHKEEAITEDAREKYLAESTDKLHCYCLPKPGSYTIIEH